MNNTNLDDAAKIAKALRICGFDDGCIECPMNDGVGNVANPQCWPIEERAASLLEAQATKIDELEAKLAEAMRERDAALCDMKLLAKDAFHMTETSEYFPTFLCDRCKCSSSKDPCREEDDCFIWRGVCDENNGGKI